LFQVAIALFIALLVWLIVYLFCWRSCVKGRPLCFCCCSRQNQSTGNGQLTQIKVLPIK